MSHVVTAAVAALTATAALLLADPAIPACQYEDGSDIVGVCEWTDPDTGDVYRNED